MYNLEGNEPLRRRQEGKKALFRPRVKVSPIPGPKPGRFRRLPLDFRLVVTLDRKDGMHVAQCSS